MELKVGPALEGFLPRGNLCELVSRLDPDLWGHLKGGFGLLEQQSLRPLPPSASVLLSPRTAQVSSVGDKIRSREGPRSPGYQGPSSRHPQSVVETTISFLERTT